MSEKWCKTPKYLLRENVIERLIRNWHPARFLELGPGTGEMTKLFLERGYKGVCFDIGKESRKYLLKNLYKYKDSIQVVENLNCLDKMSFDFIFAFEVLEHVSNDIEELKKWTSYLKPGGEALFSVPAHMKKFNKDDESVGHVKRYEKDELYKLLIECGYANVKIYNYGFPLGNFSRIVSNLIKPKQKRLVETQEERSVRSGIERSETVNKLSFMFNRVFIFPFLYIQIPFLNCDFGDGYIFSANKT